MNREDWNVACYTLQRSPIAESHSDRMVESAIDNEELGAVTLPSVRDSIRVGRDIQLIAGFELAVVCTGWNELVPLNAGKSMTAPNNAVVKILLVQLLNVEHEAEHFLRPDPNVYM